MMQQSKTEKGLSQKQELAIEFLIAGASITQAAEEVGIARSTIHRWLKDDFDFQARLNGLRRRLRNTIETRLVSLLDRAVDTVASSIDDGDARTALAILKGTGMLPGELPVLKSDDATILRQQSDVEAQEESAELSRRSMRADFAF